jgi:broad specificity phosphatase PhoE
VIDGDRPARPPADRVDAPLYLARHRARVAEQLARNGDGTLGADEPTEPIYLRRFRDRQVSNGAGPSALPLWQRSSLEMQQALTEDNRNKEISPPPEARRTMVSDVYLIRHGETQGYSTDSGLTPQGVWQAHTYGLTLAKRIRGGETVVFRHAATNRARETAEQIHRGLVEGLVMFEKDIKIHEPEPVDSFRNFQFAAPDGRKDVTAAFRHYYSMLEGIERTAAGDRPLWLVEMDRFWRTQQGGGDPIQHWLTIPLLHFEPPSLCVRRFWAGILALSSEFQGARLAIATHSGPIRAFAVSALGYDPGEPYNTEHVRVRLFEGGPGGDKDALVSYRNRVQQVKVPAIDELPAWSLDGEWESKER